jgi:hypothetical protein
MVNNTAIRKRFEKFKWYNDNNQLYFDWISVSQTGKYIVINNGQNLNNGGIYIYDIDLTNERKATPHAEHGDLGIDINGDDVYVQLDSITHRTEMYRLKDRHHTTLLPSNYGGHVSCRNLKREGWCYISPTNEGFREVFAVRLDYTGSQNHIVNRFGQTHNSLNSSLATVSPDGRKMLFYTDWEGKYPDHRNYDTYLIEVE